MKIFDKTEGFCTKVNFADKNNVCVGYDMEGQCCEDANWFISDKEENSIIEPQNDIDVEEYSFDPTYFVEVDLVLGRDYDDGGGMVRFRLVSEGEELFLHMYNIHNGYYGHGFTFKIDDKTKYDGYL